MLPDPNLRKEDRPAALQQYRDRNQDHGQYEDDEGPGGDDDVEDAPSCLRRHGGPPRLAIGYLIEAHALFL
jgi:hypothetical protein